MRGLYNGIWLGSKPAAQFVIGAVLFASQREHAGAFYTLVLVWTLGYSLCAMLIDRQLVVLAQRSDAAPASAVKAVLPLQCMSAIALSLLLGSFAGAVFEIPLWLSISIVFAGAASGISEAGAWAILADAGTYATLARLRVVGVLVFSFLALAHQGSFAAAIIAESAFMFAGFVFICARTIYAAPKAKLPARNILSFWGLTSIVYLYQQLDFWWTATVLSAGSLAALRLGSTPRSLALLGMSALLQPILFKISSRDWSERRSSAQASAIRATDYLIALNAAFLLCTAAAYLSAPELFRRCEDALHVGWTVAAFYAAVGWFGTLGSTIVTNHGAVRLPTIVIACSIIGRGAAYGALMFFGSLNLINIVLVAEIASCCGNFAFWRYACENGLWKIESQVVQRLWLRAGIGLPCIGFLIVSGFSSAALIVLGVWQAVALLQMRRQHAKASQSYPEGVENAA